MHTMSKLRKSELYSLLHYTGYISILLGMVMLVPILVALIYHEPHYILPFIYSSIISLLFGVGLYKGFSSGSEISLKIAG